LWTTIQNLVILTNESKNQVLQTDEKEHTQEERSIEKFD
jgi:hypothetical protein